MVGGEGRNRLDRTDLQPAFPHGLADGRQRKQRPADGLPDRIPAAGQVFNGEELGGAGKGRRRRNSGRRPRELLDYRTRKTGRQLLGERLMPWMTGTMLTNASPARLPFHATSVDPAVHRNDSESVPFPGAAPLPRAAANRACRQSVGPVRQNTRTIISAKEHAALAGPANPPFPPDTGRNGAGGYRESPCCRYGSGG